MINFNLTKDLEENVPKSAALSLHAKPRIKREATKEKLFFNFPNDLTSALIPNYSAHDCTYNDQLFETSEIHRGQNLNLAKSASIGYFEQEETIYGAANEAEEMSEGECDQAKVELMF